MSRKIVEFYRMSEAQAKDMRWFYQTLGYQEEQIDRLCRQCFGAEIRIGSGKDYVMNWSFCRNRDYLLQDEEPEDGGVPFPAPNPNQPMPMLMKGMAIPPMAMSGSMMGAGMMGAAMCSVAAPAGMMCAQMQPMAEPMMNTAETNDAPENEEHSPLDESALIFSANVNTASWDYLRSKIKRGQKVDRSFVRIEEILNSYSYDLPKPEGDDLFAITAENGPCPWNQDAELLFLGFQGKKAQKDCRQNLVFLVDVSGSMEDNWILTQMSMMAIISKLKKGDVFSVIAYSDETVTVEKNVDAGDRERCVDAVLKIDGIGGCTNGSDGLKNAYDYLQEHFDEENNNRVFIFTDGDFNFGITGQGGLRDFILEKRKTGIFLSIVGYGEGNFKDNKMETLARNGNGNYTFVSNPNDILDHLWEKLVSNLVNVAMDVKISVEFNPELVREYRLLGYDARMLTQKEFYDTEKAVDGIGSEHQVAALIEWKRGQAQKKYQSRYVTVSAQEHSEEIAFIEIHYHSPEGENKVLTRTVTAAELEQAARKNVGTASLLASFGLLVKESDYKGNMTKEKLAELLQQEMQRREEQEPAVYSHLDVIRTYTGR